MLQSRIKSSAKTSTARARATTTTTTTAATTEAAGLLSDPDFFISNEAPVVDEDTAEDFGDEDDDEDMEDELEEDEAGLLGSKRGTKGLGLPASVVNSAKKVNLPLILNPATAINTNGKVSLPPIYPNSRPLQQHPLRIFPEGALNYAQQALSFSGIAATGGLAGAASMASGAAAAKIDKGLRHFSAKVCAKVEERGCTSYNEVADDLVKEIGLEMGKCDHKNIRRRVYDALNVLMAIDIIRKDKKEIRWLGLPNETADDIRALEAEKAAIQRRLADKSRNLREILRRVSEDCLIICIYLFVYFFSVFH